MTYKDAVQDLVHAGSEANSAITLSQPKHQVDRSVFGEAISQEIEAAGYPGGAELPWVVEELYLYSLDEIAERQAGYRYNARTGNPSKDWDSNQYVIADWTANPISIGADGAIRYARHGQESWTYARIAPDLPCFFGMLAAWLRYFVVERSGNLFNDDFEIDDATREAVSGKVLAAIDPGDREAALAFLLGE